MTKKYFGTDGIRGKVGTWPITVDFVLKLGWAVGKVLTKIGYGKVLIGKDTRISGYMFESALEAGLTASGVHVHLLGPMPTPAVAYLTKALGAQAGIVISASHNPYYDNGIKFFSANGYKLSNELENEIETQMENELVSVDSAELGKAVRIVNAQNYYIHFCESTISSEISLANYKIIVDCANGATYQIAPAIFRDLGAKVTAINAQPTGLNINLHSGVMHLTTLISQVLAEKADIGIAFDGDGDRVLLVDHQGEIIDGDAILNIIINEKLSLDNFYGGVVGTVMTNLGLEEMLQQKHIPFVRVPVGDQNIMLELMKKKWILGGEPSGHIVCSNLSTTGDGMLTALQVLSAMHRQKKSLAELNYSFFKYPQTIVNVRVLNKCDPNQFPAIKTEVKKIEKKLGNMGRVILRPSGTESLVRVMVEGKNASAVKKSAEELAELVQKTLNKNSK